MQSALLKLASWLRQAGFDEEAEETLGLDDDWLIVKIIKHFLFRLLFNLQFPAL